MVWLGYQTGRLFGGSMTDSILLGAMLSVSSTTIIAKALAELGKTKEHFAHLIFGILIIEDILAILMLVLLSGIAMTGSLRLSALASTGAKFAVFLAAALVVGLPAVPRPVGPGAEEDSRPETNSVLLGSKEQLDAARCLILRSPLS